ncbi:GNAT family N-acetyltransferase [Erythrobacter sp.]|uniref:GNAT family N-acetyltransferase n=1 Tax=Erythrobacter sp. TaxID=1042 RepID=UPI0025BF2301|nr:GNAT family N-acetyltransferase [Erythrobacter sp.]
MIRYAIAQDDLTSADVLALLRLHLDEMYAWSPACKVHALPVEKLRAPDVTFYAVRDGERLAAVGALKELGEGRGELKSMRAAPDYRGKGAGRALLEHLIAEARARGLTWLGLETGRTAPFEPALRLYESHGFAESSGFGDYVPDEFSLCMERRL